MYDLIIIGGGPAGSAAGVYAARKRLKTLMVADSVGGQSVVSAEIQNWIGTIKISGEELANSMRKHVEAYASDILTFAEERAEKIEAKDGNFVLTTEKGSYTTRAVLIAAGSHRRRLEAIGADQFEHKGLTYCASCDGPLFEGQDLAVVGGGNAALETAIELLAYAKSVLIFNRGEDFPRADAVTVEKILSNPKIRVINNAEITEVKGDTFVNGLVYKDKKSGETKELPIGGIFVEIGQLPNTEFVKGLVDLNAQNQIIIDPRTQQTHTKGIWAAGDCTDVLYHQNNIAAGDAVRALEDIYKTLHTK